MITGGVFLYGKETYIISKKRKYLPTRKTAPTFKEFLGAIKEAFLPLCLPIIIIGGIRIGIFTPTEAGAVAIVYALILGIVYREMEFSDFICGIKEAIVSTASIMLIVDAASSLPIVPGTHL